MNRESTGSLLSTVFVDYDNVYLSLKRKNEAAAKRFAKCASTWINAIASGELITPTNGLPLTTPRRIVMNRCYGNPVPRRNAQDNATDMNSFPFVRHHYLRAGFEVIDCPPLTAQLKNSADIRMVMDVRDYLLHDTYFDEFIILSGDADFTPVLHRLRAHARRTVIYANDYTAAPYRAISDGEIRESDLISLLVEGDLQSDQIETAEKKGLPSPEMLTQTRSAIINEVLGSVRNAQEPVPLEALADRAVRVLGHDKTVGTAWGGVGSFRDLLAGGLPAEIKLTDQAPYYVIDTSRHQPSLPEAAMPEPTRRAPGSADTFAQPTQPPIEPSASQHSAQTSGQRGTDHSPASRTYSEPQPTAYPTSQGAPDATREPGPVFDTHNERSQAEAPSPHASMDAPAPRTEAGRPVNEPSLSRYADPPERAQPATPTQAPQPSSAQSAQPGGQGSDGFSPYPTSQPVRAETPSASANPPGGTAPAGDRAMAIQQSIARIHEACQAPPLSPPEYRVLFEVMAKEITANGLTGARTLVNIVQAAQDLGVNLRRDDARFILEIVSEADPWFEQGASANLFASRFRNFVVARCRGQGLNLSADELDLIDAWFSGAAPTAASGLPSRSGGTDRNPAPSQGYGSGAGAPDRQSGPAASAGALGEVVPRRAGGAPDMFGSADHGTDDDDEFPRIIRTRARG